MPAGFLDLFYKSITDVHKFIAICDHFSTPEAHYMGEQNRKVRTGRVWGLKRHRHRVSAITP